MKVLAVVERSWFGVTPSGGAEVMIHGLLKSLSQYGWRCTALVGGGTPGAHEIDGIRVYTGRDKAHFSTAVREADVIITHLGGTPEARALCKVYEKPLVQLIHNTSEYTVGFLAGGTELAIYNTNWVKNVHQDRKSDMVVKEWQNRQLAKIRFRECLDWPYTVVHPPVLDRCPSSGAGPRGRVTLINLVPNKGPDIFYRLAEANPGLDFMAVVGGYEPADQVIRDLPNVKIQEHSSDIDKIYSQSSVIVMPSVYESYGLVAVEAMGRGIPVIASDTPGLSECLQGAGIQHSREDFDDWNSSLLSLIDRNVYQKYSLRGLQRYEDLRDQSVGELAVLDTTLRGLVKEWRS